MESPDYLYVNSGGVLSPSLWDEDWKETPDALKNDVTLGSPQGSVLSTSFDGHILPDDDDLMWMEKSCNLQSLTELHDVSVQDVDEIPMEDKPVILPPGPEQMTYTIGKDEGEAVVSDGLFRVEGVEDLFHDYIDPDVYMVKEERRVSIDSCVSNGEDIQDSFFPSTRDHVGKDIDILDYNERQGCLSRIDHQPVPAVPVVSTKLPEARFVNATRPILPKPQGFKMVPPNEPIRKAEAPKVLKVVPVSTQQSLLFKPVIVNAKTISVKANTPKIPIKIRKLSEEDILGETKASEDVNGVVVKSPTLVQNRCLQIESGQINQGTVGFPASAKTMSAKEASINDFLSALQKEENLTPLQALLEESNDARIKQPSSFPLNQKTWHTHSFQNKLAAPVKQVDLTEPIVNSPSSSFEQSVEVITYESIIGSSITDKTDPPLQVEDLIVTVNPDLQMGLDSSVEMLDLIESSPQNEFQTPPRESYLAKRFVSDLSSDSLSPVSTKSYSPSPRKAGRKRGNLPAEEKKSRKKVQNKEAAIRYRQKKRFQYDLFVREENELYEKNKKLQSEKDGIVTEIKYLKGLLRDLYKAKGLIK